MKINKFIITLIGLTTLLGIQTANAGVLGNQYPICALAIYPYWSEAPEIIGTAGTSLLNFRDDLCKANLNYPAGSAKEYPQSQLSDEKTPLKTGAEGKKVPIGLHTHSYYNDSVDDDKYYKSFVKAFQIKLESDTVANVDKFYCDYPYPGNGSIPANYINIVPSPAQVKAALGDVCKNWKSSSLLQTSYIPNLWGGTKIEYNPSAQTITWIFAVDKTDWYPVFYGDNDGSGAAQDNFLDNIIGLDTNIAANRKFTNSIDLETKDLSATRKSWSATTTSRILLRNMGVTKSTAKIDPSILGKGCTTANNYNQGWCSLPANGSVVSSYNGQTLPTNFFWFDIGNAVSIWKSGTPAPLACADLQWDGPFWKMTAFGKYIESSQNVNALLSKEEAIMKFRTIYQNGTAPKRPLEYRWVAFNGETNRPAWFINDDSLFVINEIFKNLNTNFAPFLINNLPAKVLTIAHAAPSSVKNNASGSTSAVQTITNSGSTNALSNSGILNNQSAPLSNPAINPDIAQLILILGKFSDESTSPLLSNPLTDDDNQIHYTGGTAGVTLGVQAYYTDGQNIPGQGAWVDVGGMMKQKAEKCHLELTIQDKPNVPPPLAICKALNLNILGLVGGEIPVNTAISLSTDPRDTNNALRDPVVYKVVGSGSFTPVAGNPLTCPPRSTRTFEAPSECKYTFQATSSAPGDGISIRVKADDGVPACTAAFSIAEKPVVPICKALNLTTSPNLVGGQIPVNTPITLSTDPRDTNDNPRQPVVYEKTGSGTFVPVSGNSLLCPPRSSRNFEAPSECKYTFSATTAVPGDNLTVKVKQNDNVPACTASFPVTETPKVEEKCLALNLQVNGQYTLNPLLTPGDSYSLQTAPITTKGNPVIMVEWTENGSGQLIGTAGNPAICPAAINNGSVVTPAFCRYIYSSPAGASDTDGFSVRAVPDDNVTACRAIAQKYTPPVVKPYCLYLDLDYYPEPFNPLISSGMNATVVMSDGSKYNDRVRFNSSNGAGTFSGGLSSTGTGTYDLRSLTDITNNTGLVTFSIGNENTGINVLLSDTTVIQTAACQRQLRPRPKPPQVCTEPPRITRNGNTFTTPVGNSNEYCWSISGNALFNNGRNTATGRTVILNDNYTNFNLRVEDCNPQFRNFCSDTYKADNTPSIEKKISKADSPLRYGTKINYSTTGNNSAQTVAYKIEFTPSNYTSGTYMLAKIYDPAFEGTIQGYKTSSDGKKEIKGGDINFSGIESSLKVSGFSGLCVGTTSPKDKCFSVNKANGYLQLNGINSPEKITIEYTGQLKSGITRAECQNGTYCNEQFINQSYVTEMEVCVARISPTGVVSYDCTDVPKPPLPRCEYFYNDKGERVSVNGNNQDCKMPKYTIASNTTIAELVCQYFLTRASGDIFLEDELEHGIDVSKCYPFKNISSTITKPATPLPPKAPSTGTAQIVNISHEICSSGQANFAGFQGTNEQKTALKDLFGADISKLSSQICEVGLVPGSDWDKTSINTAITQNIGKLTRWDDGNARSQTINNIQQIIDQGGVYYYKGNGETVTIPELKIPEGSGALTIIVENADLQINGNIEYSANTPATNAKQISSLGVIVINGNMYVAPSVSKLAGAYFVQRTLAETDVAAYLVGNIFSGNKADNKQDSEVQLTINGSIYGNIGPLFERRNAAGDINNDEGAITIRYDQRIIQNPPPGLSEILGSFSQSQIAQ